MLRWRGQRFVPTAGSPHRPLDAAAHATQDPCALWAALCTTDGSTLMCTHGPLRGRLVADGLLLCREEKESSTAHSALPPSPHNPNRQDGLLQSLADTRRLRCSRRAGARSATRFRWASSRCSCSCICFGRPPSLQAARAHGPTLTRRRKQPSRHRSCDGGSSGGRTLLHLPRARS